MNKYTITTFFILYIYFYTPHFIVNIVLKIVCGRLKFTYIFNYSEQDITSKVITYKFDHGFYDGNLMKHYIENSNSYHTRIIKTPKILYENFQVINIKKNYNHIKIYSSLTYVISTILQDMQTYYKKHYSNKLFLKVGIVVSKRKLLKNTTSLGNYIRTAYYQIGINDSFDKICETHNNIVKNEQSNKNLFNRGYSIHSMIKCDIFFNSHRDLSYIERKDGNTLTLIRNKQFKNKNDMEEHMFNKNIKKRMIFLDFLDNEWIIRSVKNKPL